MRLKKQISDVLKKEPVEFAYLYGSVAEGRETEMSDLDIGIFIEEPGEFGLKELGRLKNELDRATGREVDLRVLNDSEIVFQHQVLSKGELIFSSNEEERVSFETDVYKKYLDFKPFFKKYSDVRRSKTLS